MSIRFSIKAPWAAACLVLISLAPARAAEYFAELENQPSVTQTTTAEATQPCAPIPRCCPDGSTGGPSVTDGGTAEGYQGNYGSANDSGFNLTGTYAALNRGGWSINSDPAGYIDNPIVGTWFRLRYDDAHNNDFPDRAEFFYAKYGSAGGAGPAGRSFNGGNTLVTPSSVDFQTVTPYMELQIAPRLSVFAEIPITWVDITTINPSNPAQSATDSNAGLGDVIGGFKYALYVTDRSYLTAQFKVYTPTGNSHQGLGTHHTSLEPGFLYLRRLGDKSYFMGELRHWVPLDGSNFAGQVLRYGGGFGYDIWRSYGGASPLNPYNAPGTRVTAVTEFVAWSIFGGRATDQSVQQGVPIDDIAISKSTNGDIICNLKLGVRVTRNQGSLYAGWGHALTDQAWYDDLFRLEYRRQF